MKLSPIANWWVGVRFAALFVALLATALIVGVEAEIHSGRPSWEQSSSNPLCTVMILVVGYPLLVYWFIPLRRHQYIEINPLGVVWRDRIAGEGAVGWADMHSVVVATKDTQALAPLLGSGRRHALLWVVRKDQAAVALPCRSGYPGARRYARKVARRIIANAPWSARLELMT
jgi:hypothetical protein